MIKRTGANVVGHFGSGSAQQQLRTYRDIVAALMEDTMSGSQWRARLKDSIRQKLAKNSVPQDHIEAETDKRFQAVIGLEVPTDAELRAMQQRGELPPDEATSRDNA
jgi:hypothetical protein